MKCATVFLGAARKVFFTLGTLFALCLMAFASMGGVASAHAEPSHHEGQVNAQICNQSARSEAKFFAHTDTNQNQTCIYIKKLNVKIEQKQQEPGNSDNQDPRPSHKEVNIQVCNQSAKSNAKFFAFTNTNQKQTCVFVGKLNVKIEHEQGTPMQQHP